VITVISLNALVAVGFGYLYWKRGLESAMLAHFSADVVLHVLGPIL
jgi:membrane protease YdiL (CAAX protease family)